MRVIKERQVSTLIDLKNELDWLVEDGYNLRLGKNDILVISHPNADYDLHVLKLKQGWKLYFPSDRDYLFYDDMEEIIHGVQAAIQRGDMYKW